MDKSEIHIIGSIAHILDAGVGEPFFSNQKLFIGSDFSDFLKEHITKIATSDDSKACSFYENESRVFQILKDFRNKLIKLLSFTLAIGLLFESTSYARNELSINMNNVDTECSADLVMDMNTGEILFSKNNLYKDKLINYYLK